ncbi:uncharacterized protein BJ171DRAFT_599225 [Polychytrium aggregatum]|uniref:uncharacterized protein n=1 Tax=Polychytrium aggregatum TaxID=110093 RepID=UPI0022FE9339|nr:uncharacterized protein BJ171DRAFT_599225 [Polychytrium aggregatum]KAI9204422.1 hypothetical protein BJ171DRAFT_599225 [Polychytrium aggregatum]
MAALRRLPASSKRRLLVPNPSYARPAQPFTHRISLYRISTLTRLDRRRAKALEILCRSKFKHYPRLIIYGSVFLSFLRALWSPVSPAAAAGSNRKSASPKSTTSKSQHSSTTLFAAAPRLDWIYSALEQAIDGLNLLRQQALATPLLSGPRHEPSLSTTSILRSMSSPERANPFQGPQTRRFHSTSTLSASLQESFSSADQVAIPSSGSASRPIYPVGSLARHKRTEETHHKSLPSKSTSSHSSIQRKPKSRKLQSVDAHAASSVETDTGVAARPKHQSAYKLIRAYSPELEYMRIPQAALDSGEEFKRFILSIDIPRGKRLSRILSHCFLQIHPDSSTRSWKRHDYLTAFEAVEAKTTRSNDFYVRTLHHLVVCLNCSGGHASSGDDSIQVLKRLLGDRRSESTDERDHKIWYTQAKAILKLLPPPSKFEKEPEINRLMLEVYSRAREWAITEHYLARVEEHIVRDVEQNGLADITAILKALVAHGQQRQAMHLLRKYFPLPDTASSSDQVIRVPNETIVCLVVNGYFRNNNPESAINTLKLLIRDYNVVISSTSITQILVKMAESGLVMMIYDVIRFFQRQLLRNIDTVVIVETMAELIACGYKLEAVKLWETFSSVPLESMGNPELSILLKRYAALGNLEGVKQGWSRYKSQNDSSSDPSSMEKEKETLVDIVAAFQKSHRFCHLGIDFLLDQYQHDCERLGRAGLSHDHILGLINWMLKGVNGFDDMMNVYAGMKHVGLRPNLMTFSHILGNTMSDRNPDMMWKVFCELRDSIGISREQYITFIHNLIWMVGLERARIHDLLDMMKRDGVEIDMPIYHLLLRRLGFEGKWREMLAMMDDMAKQGIQPQERTINTIGMLLNNIQQKELDAKLLDLCLQDPEADDLPSSLGDDLHDDGREEELLKQINPKLALETDSRHRRQTHASDDLSTVTFDEPEVYVIQKFESFSDARQADPEMPLVSTLFLNQAEKYNIELTSTSFRNMIDKLVKVGYIDEAADFIDRIEDRITQKGGNLRDVNNIILYSRVISGYRKKEDGEKMFAWITRLKERFGKLNDPTVIKQLVRWYTAGMNPEGALKLLDELSEFHNHDEEIKMHLGTPEHFYEMARYHRTSGNLLRASEMMKEMLERNIMWNQRVYVQHLDALRELHGVSFMLEYHLQFMHSPPVAVRCDSNLNNYVLSVLVRNGRQKQAWDTLKYFLERKKFIPNIRTFNVLLLSTHQSISRTPALSLQQVDHIYRLARETYKLQPNLQFYTQMIQWYGRFKQIDKVEAIWKELLRSGLTLDLRLFEYMISFMISMDCKRPTIRLWNNLKAMNLQLSTECALTYCRALRQWQETELMREVIESVAKGDPASLPRDLVAHLQTDDSR